MEFAALRFIINIHLTKIHINLLSTQFAEPHIKINGWIQYKEIPVLFLTNIVMTLFDCIGIKMENSCLQFAFFLIVMLYIPLCVGENIMLYLSVQNIPHIET
jgi:hypothetical protein